MIDVPQQKARGSQQANIARQGPLYSSESIACTCARFISHLFACPESRSATTPGGAKLSHFIAYALHRTKLHSSVAFTALILLQRLKTRLPAAGGSSGHRLFISAFMVATKVLYDEAFTSKSWVDVAQRMFPLREINQMERELCKYLHWELSVDGQMLANFQKEVTKNFCQDYPSYPIYPPTIVSKSSAPSTSLIAATPLPRSTVDTTATLDNPSHHPLTPSSDSDSTRRTPSISPSSSLLINLPASAIEILSQALTASKSAALESRETLVVRDVSPQLHFTHIEEACAEHPLEGEMFSFAVPSRF